MAIESIFSVRYVSVVKGTVKSPGRLLFNKTFNLFFISLTLARLQDRHQNCFRSSILSHHLEAPCNFIVTYIHETM